MTCTEPHSFHFAKRRIYIEIDIVVGNADNVVVGDVDVGRGVNTNVTGR
jgi:hypothetical protein